MGKGDTSYNLPPQQSVGESMRESLEAQIDLAPELFRAEADVNTGRKAYARLNNEIMLEGLLGELDTSVTPTYRQREQSLRDALGDYEKKVEQSQKDYDFWNSQDNRYKQGYGWTKDWTRKYNAELNKRAAALKSIKGEQTASKAELDQFLADRHAGVLPEDPAGDPPKRLGGGLVDLITGTGEKRFATGEMDEDGNPIMETRRAGFDAEGNFAGVDTMGKDMQADAARRSRAEDIAAINEFGEAATDAYREQGDIKGALADVKNLTDVSSIPGQQIDSRGDGLSMFASRQGYDRVSSPLGSPQPEPGGGKTPTRVPQQGQQQPMQQDFIGPRMESQPQPDLSSAQRFAQAGRGSGIMGGALGGVTGAVTGGGASVGTTDFIGPRVQSQPYDSTPVQTQNAYGKVGRQRAQPEAQSSKTPTQLPPQAQQQQQPGVRGGKTPTQIPQAKPNDWNSLRQGLVDTASEDLAMGGDLSFRERRALEEGARAASSARGRGRDFSGVVNEVSALEQGRRSRENQRKAFAAGVSGQETQTMLGLTEMDQRAQMANQAARAAQSRLELGALEKDMDRGIAVAELNERMRQSGLAADRGFATQRVGLEQATSADPFQAILGRASGAGVATGQQLYGNAAGSLGASPGLYNPMSGLGYISDAYANAANLEIGRMGADATKSAGMSSMFGSIIGGLGGGYLSRR